MRLLAFAILASCGNQWFALPIWEKGCVNLAPGAVCDMGVLAVKAVDPFSR